MLKTLPVLLLCAIFTGCCSLPAGISDQVDRILVRNSPPSETALTERGDWWRASTITMAEATCEFEQRRGKSGMAAKFDGIHSITGSQTEPARIFPSDLNKGKSFWAPDREFDYLFEHYEYPDRPWWRDFAEMPSALWKDTKHLVKPRYIITLGIGAALAGGTRSMDHDIADHFRDTDVLGDAEGFGNTLGNPGLHLGIAGCMYLYGRLGENSAVTERSLILAEGLIINDLATLALKAAFQRTRPNGDNLSFPSGHVSSTFALASMLDEMYGHRVGYPMYALGGFVALARMNDREHYLSDTVFAAFLGYAIGKAVFDRHQVEIFGFHLQPFTEENTGAFGLSFTGDL